MEYDVFISYAHHDNEAHESWIHEFEERLSADYRSRTGQRLRVFLDKDTLNTGNVLSDRLQQAIDASALFLPILSPTYLASAWCRREFLHYKTCTGENLILEGNSRILPIRLMPYDLYRGDTAEERREVEEVTGFLTGKEILYADFHRDPLPVAVSEEGFRKKIAELSTAIYKVLQSVRQQEEAVKSPPRAEGIGLFLGYAYGEAKKLRDQLAIELQQQRKYKNLSIRILPEDTADAPKNPRELSERKIQAFIQGQLKVSDMAVFFYDDVEGAKPADNPHAPIAHLQYELALKTAKEQPGYRIFYSTQHSEDCALSQLAFLNNLDKEAASNAQVQCLPAFELKAIRDLLMEYLQKPALPPPPPPATVAGTRIFYVHHHLDKKDPLWAQIDDLMYENNYEVIRTVFPEDDPLIDVDLAMQNSWLISHKALVLLRHATPTWCNAKKVELIKTATEKAPPYQMAICVADPDAADRIRQVRSHEFKVIDCAKDGFEQEILTFLKDASHV